MNATILLSGYLTEEKFGEMWRELGIYQKLAPGELPHLHLVIDSTGGVADAALETVRRIQTLGFQCSAKIYRAYSAAAFIALSAGERDMVRSGIIEINLGSAEVDSATLITKEKVPATIIAQARRWRMAMSEVLNKCGFPDDGKYMSRLLAQNRLRLTAEECLALGIVPRII